MFLVFNSIHRQRLLDTHPSSVERYFDEAVKKAKQLEQLKNKRGGTEMRKATKGWTTKTVDELFDVQLGKMLNEIAKGGDGQFPYLTNTNVQWGEVDWSLA